LSDSLTILRAPYRRLAKMIRADGTIIGYDDARTFDIAEVTIRDLDRLAAILRKLLTRPDCCIVRGAVADPARTSHVRRLIHLDAETGDLPTLRDTNRRWIGLDVEGVTRPADIPAADLAGCAQVAIRLLPTEFHGARCIVQATSGHGLKTGSRLRLWYWANRPLSGAELSYWMRRAPVDNCLFRPVQPTFTSAPIFETGRDHLPARMAIIDGADMVEVPEPERLQPAPPAPPPPRARRPASNTQVERVIAAALFKVEMAGEGQRHQRLRAAARTIGGILDQAGIGEQEATQALYEAVRRAGGDAVDGRNAAGTIAWGLAKGRAAPLDLGGRN
jgi:hypothetical protein